MKTAYSEVVPAQVKVLARLQLGTAIAIALAALGLFVEPAVASDLMRTTSTEGRTCAEEFEVVTAKKLNLSASVISAVTFASLTPGSWYQKFTGVVTVRTSSGAQAYTVALSGQYDCDDLQIESISAVPQIKK